MIKGVKGEEFKHWIDQVNHNVTKLCAELKIAPRTFYNSFKKEVVEWSYVNRVHNYLKKHYEYDITAFFTNYSEYEAFLVNERYNHGYTENATMRALKKDLELVQAENNELSKKLNRVYEQLLDSRYMEMVEIMKSNNAKMQHFIDSFDKK